MRVLILMVTSTLLISACQPAPKNVEKMATETAIQETWASFIRAWEGGDAARAAAHYTVDAINMVNYTSVQNGQAEIESTFRRFLEGGRYKVLERATTEVIAPSADFAYELGTVRQTYTPTGGQPVLQELRYSSVFVRAPDGVWRFYRWMAQGAN